MTTDKKATWRMEPKATWQMEPDEDMRIRSEALVHALESCNRGSDPSYVVNAATEFERYLKGES